MAGLYPRTSQRPTFFSRLKDPRGWVEMMLNAKLPFILQAPLWSANSSVQGSHADGLLNTGCWPPTCVFWSNGCWVRPGDLHSNTNKQTGSSKCALAFAITLQNGALNTSAHNITQHCPGTFSQWKKMFYVKVDLLTFLLPVNDMLHTPPDSFSPWLTGTRACFSTLAPFFPKSLKTASALLPSKLFFAMFCPILHSSLQKSQVFLTCRIQINNTHWRDYEDICFKQNKHLKNL